MKDIRNDISNIRNSSDIKNSNIIDILNKQSEIDKKMNKDISDNLIFNNRNLLHVNSIDKNQKNDHEWTKRKIKETIQHHGDLKHDVSDLKSQQTQNINQTGKNMLQTLILKNKINDIDINEIRKAKLLGTINKYILDDLKKHEDQNQKSKQRLDIIEENINEGKGMIETLKEDQAKTNETLGTKLNNTIINQNTIQNNLLDMNTRYHKTADVVEDNVNKHRNLNEKVDRINTNVNIQKSLSNSFNNYVMDKMYDDSQR